MSMQVVFLIPIFSSTQTYFHLVYQWPGKLCYQICKLYLSTSINESLETHPRVSQPPLVISGFIHFWQILFLAKWRMNGFSSCHSLFRDFLSNFGRYLSSHRLKTLVFLTVFANPQQCLIFKKIPNVEYFYVKNGTSILLKNKSFEGFLDTVICDLSQRKSFSKFFKQKFQFHFSQRIKKLFRPLCFYSLKRRFFQ